MPNQHYKLIISYPNNGDTEVSITVDGQTYKFSVTEVGLRGLRDFLNDLWKRDNIYHIPSDTVLPSRSIAPREVIWGLFPFTPENNEI